MLRENKRYCEGIVQDVRRERYRRGCWYANPCCLCYKDRIQLKSTCVPSLEHQPIRCSNDKHNNTKECWRDYGLGNLLHNTCGGFHVKKERIVLCIDSKEHSELWQQVSDFMVCLLRCWLPSTAAGIAICFTCQVFHLQPQRAQTSLSSLKVPG